MLLPKHNPSKPDRMFRFKTRSGAFPERKHVKQCILSLSFVLKSPFPRAEMPLEPRLAAQQCPKTSGRAAPSVLTVHRTAFRIYLAFPNAARFAGSRAESF